MRVCSVRSLAAPSPSLCLHDFPEQWTHGFCSQLHAGDLQEQNPRFMLPPFFYFVCVCVSRGGMYQSQGLAHSRHGYTSELHPHFIQFSLSSKTVSLSVCCIFLLWCLKVMYILCLYITPNPFLLCFNLLNLPKFISEYSWYSYHFVSEPY